MRVGISKLCRPHLAAQLCDASARTRRRHSRDPGRDASAVDVGHLQVCDLGHPQARAVGDAERPFYPAGRPAKKTSPRAMATEQSHGWRGIEKARRNRDRVPRAGTGKSVVRGAKRVPPGKNSRPRRFPSWSRRRNQAPRRRESQPATFRLPTHSDRRGAGQPDQLGSVSSAHTLHIQVGQRSSIRSSSQCLID